jgi:hypothetical protein
MEAKIVISLTEMEAMQVERIALDRNRDEALKMIEKVFLKRADQEMAEGGSGGRRILQD